MNGTMTSESQTPAPARSWLSRTLVATIYLATGAGNMALAAHFATTLDTGNFLLTLAGGICGCFAACGVLCARR